ncbi:MAG: 4Fe-4S double cluster binding domain-containing protein [Planctomycetota bacterium]|jgi:epoxyqueuosine reductase QueG
MPHNHIDQQQTLLAAELKEKGASLIGFGDVSAAESQLTSRYPVAIALALKYSEKIVDNLHTDDEAFRQFIAEMHVQLDKLYDVAESLLSDWQYDCVKIPHSITAETLPQMRSDFPVKIAATCANLGWIGKCGLLVTEEYGPRLGLGAILTDARFRTAIPTRQSKCGDCRLCTEACPVRAIKGVNWKRAVDRHELLDASRCNQKRREGIPVIGRKYQCGLCVQACPIGRKRVAVR